jgi:predicted AAA+ superfamily ATPase
MLPETLPSFQLYPDFSEREKIYQYYLKFGGYPALVDDRLTDDDRFDWLLNYVRTYLERDIRDLVDFKLLEPFVKIQKISSQLTGQQLNYTQLGKEAGISSKTALRFMQYLEISYQTILLQPWYSNHLKRLTKTSKLHYLDPGVQKAILQKKGELTGNEFESAVVAEIYKQLRAIKFAGSLYHLRTQDGREIDLLIETENGFIPIEIKMTSHVIQTDTKHLRDLETILTKPIIKSFVISNDNSIKHFDHNILALPASLFLS